MLPRRNNTVSTAALDCAMEKVDPELIGDGEPVRELKTKLYTRGDDGICHLAVPEYMFFPLDPDSDEVRLLLLHPTPSVADHVRCNLETHPAIDLPSFVAIKNARGYRFMKDVIEVNERALRVSIALERFLRYLQTRIKEPTRIWVRHVCVVESDPQEQKKYWTREFSDIMYAMASKVFDMHEINSRLVENGYFGRVAEIGYQKWVKEWYPMPEESIPPSVFPIRLGTEASHEVPTAEFQYMPLDMIADEIRILCIMPSEDRSAPIVIHLAHCPIKCEVHFVALSYRWGTDDSPEQIVLNGQKKSIRKTLAEAIRTIRQTDAIVPIWIDALSINQDDTVERRRQVLRMGSIYDNALVVYSYVGEQSDDLEEAIDFIEELSKHPMVRTNDLGEFHFGKWGSTGGDTWYGENGVKPDELVKLCAAAYKFLSRPYFRRVWILQEVAYASNPTIISGCKLQPSFDHLDMAAYNLHDMMIRDMSLMRRMEKADPSLGEVRIDVLAYSRKLFYFRHLVSHGTWNPFHFMTPKITSPGFLEALVLTRDFECTDPRDHIYSLWNLVQDKQGLDFSPNYTERYEDVYVEFARAWIAQHRTLDILGAVEVTPQSRFFYHHAPSWCPNWNIPATTSCLVRKDSIPARLMRALEDQNGELYSADGGMNGDSFDSPLFCFDGNVLHCTGLIIDQIKMIFDDAPKVPVGPIFPSYYPDWKWKFHYWTHEIKDHFRKNGLATYEDPLRAAWAMLHGDNCAAWPPRAESGYELDILRRDHANERYVCLPQRSRHILRYVASYERNFAWDVVRTVLRGRRPFILEDGHMGLAPGDISMRENDEKKPWALAIVAGCSVPLLLRERDDGTYQLIGTCFVQGWMDGEWIETMMGAGSPREFWDAVKDEARLKIS